MPVPQVSRPSVRLSESLCDLCVLPLDIGGEAGTRMTGMWTWTDDVVDDPRTVGNMPSHQNSAGFKRKGSGNLVLALRQKPSR